MQQILNKPSMAAILVIIGAILFATKPVLIKLMYVTDDLEAIHVLFIRMLFSVPFYLFILFRYKSKAEVKEQLQLNWKPILLLGFIGYYLSSYLDFKGLQYISAGLERVILFLNPTMVLILSALYFSKKIKLFQIIAIGISYLGIAIAFLSQTNMADQSSLVIGGGLVFLAAFSYAIYLVGAEAYIKRVGTVPFTCYTMVIAFFIISLQYVLTTPLSDMIEFKSEIYLYGIYIAAFSTIIPSFMIAEGIKRIGANNASIISAVGPVATIIMAWFILHEKVSTMQVVGSALVILGVIFISYHVKTQAMRKQKV